MSTTRWLADAARGERPALARAALLQAATGASGIALLATSAWLIATAAGRPSVAALGVAIVGVRFFGLARGLSRYIERLATHRATLGLLGRLQARLFRALVPLGPAWLHGRGRGDVLTRMVSDIESLDGLFVRVIVPAVSSVMVALFVLAVLGWSGWPLALVAGAGLAAVGALLPIVFERLGSRPGSRAISQRAALADRLEDLFHGLADLALFDRTSRYARGALRLSRQVVVTQSHAERMAATGSAVSVFVADLTAVGVLLAAAAMASRSQFDRVHVAVVVLAVMASFEVAQSLAAAFQGLGAHMEAAGRIREVFAARPLVAEPASALQPPSGTRLEIRALTFSYPGEASPALDGVTLTLERGRTVAIVGASGSGKSTMVSLLARHWDVGPRMIQIDGRDVRSCATGDVRRLLSVAAQPVGILTGTLRENLVMAAAEATAADLARVLDEVGLGPMVRRLPDRLETWIGEHGVMLSGGEQQRLSVARALLRQAPFLVLDEPTAHLDAAGEADIFALVARQRANRGVLVTSHRLAGLAWVDEIVVLAGGRVAQQGPFAELAATDGWFQRVLALQRDELAGFGSRGPLPS